MRRALLPALAVLLALSACSSSEAARPSPEPIPPSQSAQPEQVDAGFVSGLTIPWAIGGLRQYRDGTTKHFSGEWPESRVPAIRLWDTFTTWANLQPAPHTWSLHRLDRFVQKAIDNGTTDITLVLGGTPQWAATQVSSSDAAWIGPGSASMPTDIELWRQYVREVATRYKGRITSYEIGNEPNLPMFWSGTPEQYRELTEVAAQEISAIDPDATVIAQVGLVRKSRDLISLADYTRLIATVPGIDVLSVHVYPRARKLDETAALLANIKTTLANNDPLNRPAWVTEVNVRDGATLNEGGQHEAVTGLTTAMATQGFARAYWYAWVQEGPDGLLPIHQGTPADRALAQQFASDPPSMS